MTKKTIKYMTGLLAVVLWVMPAAAQQPAAKEKGAVEDARISFIQMTNLRPLGQEFDNVDYIFWSKDGSSLLVDRRYADKRTDALEINIDTQAIKNLSTNRPGGGFRYNNGAPAWNPTENGYVFVGQSESSKDFARSIPSNGQQCNLWYYNAGTGKYTALTSYQLSFTSPRGVAMPRFSPDGKKVFWCGADGGKSNLIWGQRALFVGDFLPGVNPKVRNVKKLQPSDNQSFYES